MIFDCHMHTEISYDSKMKIEEILKVQKNKNLGVILTEHMDFNYPKKDAFRFNPKEYFEKYDTYRSDSLLLGVEVGMGLDIIEENKNLVNEYKFDQIIGSIHLIHGKDIFLKETYEGKSKIDIGEIYFKSMIENIKVHPYINVLGHIDYISRYWPFEDKNLNYIDFSDHIDEVLKTIAEKGIALELNTKKVENKEYLEVMRPIFLRYKEVKGEMVTLGSDAHFSENIGKSFDLCDEFLKETGLKRVHFRERKPI